MSRTMFKALVLVTMLLAPAGAAEADGWSRLRAGMTPRETLAALGEPLLRVSGKGFHVWTYDNRAEVVFFAGPVVAWTAPVGAQGVDVKSFVNDVNLVPGNALPGRA